MNVQRVMCSRIRKGQWQCEFGLLITNHKHDSGNAIMLLGLLLVRPATTVNDYVSS